MNNRGQGLSVNAIVLIVLGVVVLAVLIFGFTMGWGTLKTQIAPSNNVQTIVDGCSVACISNSQYEFCTNKRDLQSEDVGLKGVTCNYLATKQNYGIDFCKTTLSCDWIKFEDEKGGTITKGTVKEVCTTEIKKDEKKETTYQYLDKNELKTYVCVAKSEELANAECDNRKAKDLVYYIGKTKEGTNKVVYVTCP